MTPRAAAAGLLDRHHAHLVLVQPRSKVPMWRAWDRRQPTAEAIKIHRGGFGIIPWSVHCTGLDVDHGDPLNLSRLVDPLVTLQSRRRGALARLLR